MVDLGKGVTVSDWQAIAIKDGFLAGVDAYIDWKRSLLKKKEDPSWLEEKARNDVRSFLAACRQSPFFASLMKAN